MKTHFLADTHLDHESILGMTGLDYPNIEVYNDCVIENTNRVVAEHDRLFILGDFCWRGEESWVAKIKCRNKHLIFGNHDKAKLGKLFKTAEDTAVVTIGGHRVFLSHYPHAYWPASHYGSLHLYGHVHDQREETLDAAFPGRRSMDCGVPTAVRLFGEPRPFSEDEILAILLQRPGHDQVEWYEQERKARLWIKSSLKDFIIQVEQCSRELGITAFYKGIDQGHHAFQALAGGRSALSLIAKRCEWFAKVGTLKPDFIQVSLIFV